MRACPRSATAAGSLLVFLASLLAIAQSVAPGAQADPALVAKAEAGDAEAALALGEAYAKASGRAQDCKLAAEWFRKPAEKGNLEAMLRLAALERDGCKSLPRDPAAAALWYRKAAEAGDTGAQATLGTLYSFGQGLPRDYTEAYFWLDLAARAPGPKQQQFAANRQLVGTHLTTDEVEALHERVEDWLTTHKRR